MGRAAKVGIVVGGYVAAIVAGIAAGWFYDWRVSKLPYDTSGGMYAAGETLQSLAAFLVVALVPTLLGLWFIRAHTGFWKQVANASLVFAVAGLIAVLTPLVTHAQTSNVALMLVELFALAQLLGVPLWSGAFALFTLLAPTHEIRRRMVLALGVELVIGVFAAIHWVVPRSPL
jgi:hypothetical protein